MTLSHPDDLWSMLWQLNRPFFFACLSVPHTFRGATGPSQLSMARQKEPRHSDTWKMKVGGRRKIDNIWILKKANMHITTANSIRLVLTHTQNFACGYLFAAANEGMDLRTSWLIIYPASFMALINFPPLSLYLPLKVWSQPASGADNAGGLSSLAGSPL